MEQAPGPDPRHQSAAAEIARIHAEGAIAVAKKVGGDVLHLFGAGRGEFTPPHTMSDEEARRWNAENGFPESYRNK